MRIAVLYQGGPHWLELADDVIRLIDPDSPTPVVEHAIGSALKIRLDGQELVWGTRRLYFSLAERSDAERLVAEVGERASAKCSPLPPLITLEERRRRATLLVLAGGISVFLSAFVLPWITVKGGGLVVEVKAESLFGTYRTLPEQDGWSIFFGYGCFVALAAIGYAAFHIGTSADLSPEDANRLRVASVGAMGWSALAVFEVQSIRDEASEFLPSPIGTLSATIEVGGGAYVAVFGVGLVLAGCLVRVGVRDPEDV
jgi:hypothetical protein